MPAQRPGDASSPVVVDCSPGGSMYRYFTGDAVTKATMVFRWMVVYNACRDTMSAVTIARSPWPLPPDSVPCRSPPRTGRRTTK